MQIKIKPLQVSRKEGFIIRSCGYLQAPRWDRISTSLSPFSAGLLKYPLCTWWKVSPLQPLYFCPLQNLASSQARFQIIWRENLTGPPWIRGSFWSIGHGWGAEIMELSLAYFFIHSTKDSWCTYPVPSSVTGALASWSIPSSSRKTDEKQPTKCMRRQDNPG